MPKSKFYIELNCVNFALSLISLPILKRLNSRTKTYISLGCNKFDIIWIPFRALLKSYWVWCDKRAIYWKMPCFKIIHFSLFARLSKLTHVRVFKMRSSCKGFFSSSPTGSCSSFTFNCLVKIELYLRKSWRPALTAIIKLRLVLNYSWSALYMKNVSIRHAGSLNEA